MMRKESMPSFIESNPENNGVARLSISMIRLTSRPSNAIRKVPTGFGVENMLLVYCDLNSFTTSRLSQLTSCLDTSSMLTSFSQNVCSWKAMHQVSILALSSPRQLPCQMVCPCLLRCHPWHYPVGHWPHVAIQVSNPHQWLALDPSLVPWIAYWNRSCHHFNRRERLNYAALYVLSYLLRLQPGKWTM